MRPSLIAAPQPASASGGSCPQWRSQLIATSAAADNVAADDAADDDAASASLSLPNLRCCSAAIVSVSCIISLIFSNL